MSSSVSRADFIRLRFARRTLMSSVNARVAESGCLTDDDLVGESDIVMFERDSAASVMG